MPVFGYTSFSSNGSGTAPLGVSFLSPSLWGTVNSDLVIEGGGTVNIQDFTQDGVIFGSQAAGATASQVSVSIPTGIKYVKTAADGTNIAFADSQTAAHALKMTAAATAGTGCTLYFGPGIPIQPGNSTGQTPKYIEANLAFDTANGAGLTAFLGWVGSSAVLTAGATGPLVFTTASNTQSSNNYLNYPWTGLVFNLNANTINLYTNYSGTTGQAYSSTPIGLNGSLNTSVATSGLLVAGLNTATPFITAYNTATINGVPLLNTTNVTTSGLTLANSMHKYGMYYDGGQYLFAFIDGFLAAKVAVNSTFFDTTSPLAPAFSFTNVGATAAVVTCDFIAAADQYFKQ
jgi:hypothetical protein